MPENTADINNTKIHDSSNNGTGNPAAGRATAAFILGIASIVLCIAPFMLIAAVVGLQLEKESERIGIHSLQKPARILCITGIVLCSAAIAAIIGVIFVLGIISR